MSASALPLEDGGGHLGALFAAVRPEFRGEVVEVDPDDPVFARGRCAVLGCERGGWSRNLCVAHYQR